MGLLYEMIRVKINNNQAIYKYILCNNANTTTGDEILTSFIKWDL